MTAPASPARPATPELPGTWPLTDATPAAGCGRCAELVAARAAARAAWDWSAVSDANVLIRRHPH